MSTPLSLGQRAAEALKKAKVEAKANNRTLSWEEVAAIIDRCAVPAPAPSQPVNGADFGDRKKIPPTPEQVTAYSAAIGYPMDGQAWCDAYAAKGWKVGDARMKDWQAAVRNWKTNGYGKDGIARQAAVQAKGRDYGRI